MQINSVVNYQIMPKQQNFKGSSANSVSSPFSNFQTYSPIPLEASKAYASPQMAEGYKEIQTFDVPYVGKGHLYELANGHKLAIVQKPGPFVINTCVKAGFEDVDTTSHFVEHLVYNSDSQIDNESFASFQRRLGVDGNATTHDDHTNYWMEYPFSDTETIDKIIKAQAQILQSPKDFKTQMEKEKGILISEATMRAADKSNPDEAIPRFLIINNLLGLNEKPLSQDGEIEKIKNTTLEELENFYKKYYNNNNMVTFIVGDINPDDTARTFAKYFTKSNNPNGAKLQQEKQDLSKPIHESKRFDVNLDSEIDKNIQVGFIGPKNEDVKSNFLNLALKVYIKDIKGNKNLTYSDINTETLPAQDSVIIFSAGAKPEDEELVLSNINKYAANLAQKQISDKDIETLKIKLKEGFATFNESAYVIGLLGGEKLLYSNNIDFFEYAKLIDGLTKEDLQAFAQKYFDLEKSVIVVAHKKEEIKHENQPSFTGNKTSLDTSNIVEYQYPDTNLQLIVDTSPAIAKTSFRLDIKSNDVPKAKPGVLQVLTNMLIDNFENYQSKYPYISDPDLEFRINELGLITTCLPEYTKDIIPLVKDNLLNPSLTQQSLDENKKLLKESYKLNYDETMRRVKEQRYYNYNYTDGLINQLSPEEYSTAIDKITLEDIINLHKQIMVNAQGRAILVMPKKDFESQKNEIFDLIDANIPNLQPKQDVNISDKISVNDIARTKIISNVINNNNAYVEQEFQITANGNLKEDLAVKLTSIILGEQSNSRLESEIRGKKGLSYATGATYNSDGRLGYLSLVSNLPLNKDNASNLEKVLEYFRKSTEDLASNPISEEELEMAKTTLKSQIIRDLEYSGGRNDLIFNYGIDNVRNIFQIVDGISPDDIEKISQKFLAKPSIIIIKANKDVLEANKNYLSTFG